MTVAPVEVAPDDIETVYGSTVSEPQGIPQELIDQARESIAAEERAYAAWRAAQDDRNEAVGAVEQGRPENVSQNEAARLLGLNPSTYRSMTAPVRTRRRRDG